jgi:phage FluMu protein Com
MQEIRCNQCYKKLDAGKYQRLSIKRPRCGTLNELRTDNPTPERLGASEIGDSYAHPSLAGRKTSSG